MSHLQHTVALKSAMLERGITSLEVQSRVVSNAYALAIIKALFNKGHVFGQYTPEEDERVLERLNQWNAVTPIKGGLIINLVRGVFPALTSQALDLGNFKQYPDYDVEGYNYRECPKFLALVNWLVDEMVTGND